MNRKESSSNLKPSLGLRLKDLASLFSYLGVVGFGGPAAHIAMMEEEVVHRRKWLARNHFLDLVGATNLIPGPNSTEMAIHIGYIHAGVPGLLTAGAAFIAPALAMTTLLAWAYVRFGSLPQVEPFLFGIKPAVIAIILGAVWRLGKTAYKGWRLGVIGAAVVVGVLLGFNEILALLIGAVVGMLFLRFSQNQASGLLALCLPLLSLEHDRGPATIASTASKLLAQITEQVPLLPLALYFLRIGAVLYGSGYVLVAFLEGGLVDELGWLTQQQLLDAISAGQFTPGPVLSTSAFIGFQLAGLPGALVSAAAIFAPSFLFVLLLNPLIPRLRESSWTAAFLDAANISAVGLMAAVTLELGIETLVSWQAWLLGLSAAYFRIFREWNPGLLVLLSGIAGYLLLQIGS